MPSPIFDAPLTSTLVPVTAGNGTPTFTRATTAYVSAVAAAGNAVDGELLILCDANEARFAGARRVSSGVWSDKYADGSAIPLAKLLGYVAENAATNICLQSQTFDNASWSKSNAVIAADNIAAPDGTLTADRFTDDATAGNHYIQNLAGLSYTAAPYTASVYIKAGTLPWVQFSMYDGSHHWANFNLATLAVGNKAAGVTTSVVALPNGWYRISITNTMLASAGFVTLFASLTDVVAAGPAYVGTGQTMYLWGAQVETGSDPSSYVPTTTVAVVRNSDALSYPVPTNIDGVTGTAYAEPYFPTALVGSQQCVLNWGTTTAAPAMFYGGKQFGQYDGTNQVVTANVRVIGTVNKAASAWSGATASSSLNGGVVATAAHSAAGFPNSGVMYVGSFFNGTASISGSIRNVKFYATRLTDAQLIDLTEDGVLTPDVVPVTTQPGGIGRYRRQHRIEVEIDGEIFPVASEEEGRELLLKAREAAKQAAQAAAVRAAAKAEKKTSPAAVERALALSTPRISLRADDRSEALAQAIQSQVDAAQAAIDEDYATARQMAYAYVRQRLQEEQRQRELAADEEEVIAMILRLP